MSSACFLFTFLPFYFFTFKLYISFQELQGSFYLQCLGAGRNYDAVLSQKTDLFRQIRETENSLCLLIGDQAHSIARGKLENQNLPATFSTGVGIQLLNKV